MTVNSLFLNGWQYIGLVIGLGLATIGILLSSDLANKIARIGFAFLMGIVITMIIEEDRWTAYQNKRLALVSRFCPAQAEEMLKKIPTPLDEQK